MENLFVRLTHTHQTHTLMFHKPYELIKKNFHSLCARSCSYINLTHWTCRTSLKVANQTLRVFQTKQLDKTYLIFLLANHFDKRLNEILIWNSSRTFFLLCHIDFWRMTQNKCESIGIICTVNTTEIARAGHGVTFLNITAKRSHGITVEFDWIIYSHKIFSRSSVDH